MHANFVSWNPCSRAQLISCSTNKLQLLEFCDDNGTRNKRGIRELKAWTVNQVQCLDWRPCVDSPVVAYGTSIGNVHLLNVQSAEEVSEFADISAPFFTVTSHRPWYRQV
jgi:hypothetical protein